MPCKSVTHNIIQIQWDEPHRKPNDVTKYQIYHKESEAPNWSPPQETNGQVNTSSHNKLKPSQTYVFKVKAVCKNGFISDESKVSDEIKTESIFFEPPGKPKISKCSTNSIFIQWTPPRFATEGCTILLYQVYYSNSKYSHEWKSFETNELMTKIDNLEPHTNYSIKIMAKFESDISNFSEITEVKTLAPVSSKPKDLTVIECDTNNVTLQWMKPVENHDQVTSYGVEIQKEQEAFKLDSKLSHDITECKINRLVPSTIYTARVYAECHERMQSPLSDELTFKTKCEMPGCIGVPEMHSKSCNSIALKWKKPETHSENVDSYTVSCYQVTDEGNNQQSVLKLQQSVSEGFSSFKNLMPQTRYKFGVVVVSEQRLSKEVFSDVIKTATQISGPVGSLIADDISASSVTLKWDPCTSKISRKCNIV